MREGLLSYNISKSILRITPACAGRTKRNKIYGGFYGDHPRVCGKDCFKTQFTQAEIGSPTHVREERQTVVLDGKGGGITHACAGRTLQVLCCLEYRGDHPRSRGKDRVSGYLRLQKEGSPPLAREGQIEGYKALQIDRITPACAGRT